MLRKFVMSVLEVVPSLLGPLTEIFLANGDGDNRGSLDPNG